MKTNLLLLAACIFSISTAKAQRDPTAPLGRTTFGIRGGVNFQNFNGKDADGNMISQNLVTRYNFGVNLEIPVAVEFYFQPGILFTTKGSLKKATVNGQPYEANSNISYVEVPLNLIYKPLLGTGHMILGFGPYVAYGVGGKATYKLGSDTRTEKIKFLNKVESGHSTDVTYFRPFDAGANLVAGYEFSSGMSFQLNVQLGFAKVNPEYWNLPNDKSSIKNTGFGLSLGYRF